MAAGCLPLNAFAASRTGLNVTNVKTYLTITGTHYITYTIDGVDYDSRTAKPTMNLTAFRNMTFEDRKTVSKHYLPGDERIAQFGYKGSGEIADSVNDRLGYKHGRKVMHDRSQKYCADLMPYYGGYSAEDDPDRYYNREYTRLTTFTGDAALVLQKTLTESMGLPAEKKYNKGVIT